MQLTPHYGKPPTDTCITKTGIHQCADSAWKVKSENLNMNDLKQLPTYQAVIHSDTLSKQIDCKRH